MLGKTHGQASTTPVTVGYAVTSLTGDTATAGSDYTAATGTLTFAPGQSVKNIPIDHHQRHHRRSRRTLPRRPVQPHRRPTRRPHRPDHHRRQRPDRRPRTRHQRRTRPTVGEGDGYVDIPVTLSAPSPNTVTVDLPDRRHLRDLRQPLRLLTANTGTLVFTPGQTLKTIRIELKRPHRGEHGVVRPGTDRLPDRRLDRPGLHPDQHRGQRRRGHHPRHLRLRPHRRRNRRHRRGPGHAGQDPRPGLHHPRHRRLRRGHHSPATPPPPDPTTPPPPAPSPSPPANP